MSKNHPLKSIVKLAGITGLAMMTITGIGAISGAQAAKSPNATNPGSVNVNGDAKWIKLACHQSPQKCPIHNTKAKCGVRG